MDTITHGIAGALIGKAFFAPDRPDDPDAATRGAAAILGVTLGAVFPDIDYFGGYFTHDDFALIDTHRYVTHSWLCMPLWALGLALIVRGFARWRGWRSPSFWMLWILCMVGIASHIVLDMITSFGTMIWAPLSRERVSWDLVFIIDFAFTGIALAPQALAWAYRSGSLPAQAGGAASRAARRSFVVWLIFSALAELAVWVARAIGFSYAPWVAYAAPAVLAALFIGPLRKNWGLGLTRKTWCRAGCAALAGYLVVCVGAHEFALRRVREFVAENGLQTEQLGALPLPPSLDHWDALIRTPNGVYETPLALFSGIRPTPPPQLHFFADSAPSQWLEAARRQPKVQTYLWFARFPVFRFSTRPGQHTVIISDLRFFARPPESAPFTYQVTFDDSGRVLSQGWVYFMRSRR